MTALSLIIPTHDRPDDLRRTLDALDALSASTLGHAPAEVVVIDNHSPTPVRVDRDVLSNGATVAVIRLPRNIGAAARNVGAEAARGDWLVMLDDDSAPLPCDLAGALDAAPPDVLAIGGEITLPNGSREAGGLPEVVIGCGCAIRRTAFLDVGGYDPTFDYYAEEYDLCARLIKRGGRIVHTRDIAFHHRKVTRGRDFGAILFRLVRNNAWTIARHAPTLLKDGALNAMLTRYRAIASKEGVEPAFDEAAIVVEQTIDEQVATPLTDAQWRRFTGAAAVAGGLIPKLAARGVNAVRLVDRGKGADIIEAELADAGVTVDERVETTVIGALSPGPMLDAAGRRLDALTPWSPTSTQPVNI